jgi:CheY-like chemotaxis protein
MARILISESHDDMRRLLERMVRTLGHDPLAPMVPAPEQLTGADVFVIEPAAPVGAVLAQAATIAVPSLPLVCASVSLPSPALVQLGVVFTACLVKPFTIEELGAAIEEALLRPRAHTDLRCRGGCSQP